MTTVASKKAKGRRLQKEVAKKIIEKLCLEEDDVRSTSMGKAGEDIEMSPVAQKYFPFSIECKNQESMNIWRALKQAESQNRKRKPLVVFKRNRSETYCALKFDDLLDLISQIERVSEEKI